MPIKLLVVDDEPQFERLICQQFRKKIKANEYEIIFALNGVEALENLEDNKDVDIILSDINMPKMDGLTLLSKLNEFGYNNMTIIVSAYGDMKNIRTAMNLGAFDFITKPIDFKDMEATINKTIKEIELRRVAQLTKEELDHIQKQLAIASEVQNSVLPNDFDIFPEESGFELSAKMIPARDVGGDFYDFFKIDENRFGFLIGDVSGKGMPAAIFMAISHTLLRAIAQRGESVSDCLGQVNSLLSRSNPKAMFVTVFYAVLNLKTFELTYCNGGHNLPCIVNPQGKVDFLDKGRNIALGVAEDFEFNSHTTKFDLGSSLVLYTDGVTEALDNNGNEFSVKRLIEYLTQSSDITPVDIIKGMIENTKAFAGSAPQSDDITALVIKHNNQPENGASNRMDAGSGNRLTISISNDISDLKKIKTLFWDFCTTRKLPEKTANAIYLALDELINNIISYGYGDGREGRIDIRIIHEEDQVTLEIEDDGDPFNPMDNAKPDVESSIEERAVGGLGVHLVRNTMDQTDYLRKDSRNVLTMKKHI